MTTLLDESDADRLLATAVANVQRDHPVHWRHLIDSDDDLVPQRRLHPVFAGSYDWHSCVHQTWLAVRLLRLRPWLAGAAEAREVLDRLVTPEGCATEAAFFTGEQGRRWERPYGWAWLLLLDAELRGWSGGTDTATAGPGTAGPDTSGWSAAAARWAAALRPLAELLRAHWIGWLATARWPVRTGTHGNTAFAAGLVLDAARATGDTELANACVDAAHRWYAADAGYGGFEPDAADFLSPALTEADLMRRVLDPAEFPVWFERFLPDLHTPRWAVLREPVEVDDPADALGSHLAGLALSRAWAWQGLADALPADHPYRDTATAAAKAHRETGWRYVFGHGYAAEHWLGTFAAYLHLGALTSG
ncbi:DUF2891 domain-containing protein [Gandjariella thermophila]|uniref:DUF2891 domain-containing protein n=1 Tax=Gandjariella thermophila TaxID=1931992 RepID=A0A4D4J774_9PSEU|nr:DUF2891 domain-containing protein [Gandjariella thermophila]GDY30366.1 hypothetical protein GTS_19990 [Gandjariella thermophila]